jgi:hypothetical protein
VFLSLRFTKGSSYLIYIKRVLFVFLKHGVLEGGLKVVMFGFVKAIHVKLSDKTVHLIVPKIFRQHDLFEFFYVLYCEFISVRRPVYDFGKIIDLVYHKYYFKDLKRLGNESSHLKLVLVNILGLALALHEG